MRAFKPSPITNPNHYPYNPNEHYWDPSSLPIIRNAYRPLGYLHDLKQKKNLIPDLDGHTMRFNRNLCNEEAALSNGMDPMVAAYFSRKIGRHFFDIDLQGRNISYGDYLALYKHKMSDFIPSAFTHESPLDNNQFDQYATERRYIGDHATPGTRRYDQMMRNAQNALGMYHIPIMEDYLGTSLGARNIAVVTKEKEVYEIWKDVKHSHNKLWPLDRKNRTFNVTIDFDHLLFADIFSSYERFKVSDIYDNHYGQNQCDLFMEYIISTQVSSIKNILDHSYYGTVNRDIVITNFSQWVESFVNFVKQYANYFSTYPDIKEHYKVTLPIPLRVNFDWIARNPTAVCSSNEQFSKLIDRGSSLKGDYEFVKESIWEQTVDIQPISQLDVKYQFAPQTWDKIFQIKFRVNRFDEYGNYYGDYMKGKRLNQRTLAEIYAFHVLHDVIAVHPYTQSLQILASKERNLELDHDWLIYYFAVSEPIS